MSSKSSTSYGPFPDSILEEVRKLSGNNKCCDCASLDNAWGNVNHGTLVCLECAGKHRSLGVHVSFIRSLYMDTWTETQVIIPIISFHINNIIADCYDEIRR